MRFGCFARSCLAWICFDHVDVTQLLELLPRAGIFAVTSLTFGVVLRLIFHVRLSLPPVSSWQASRCNFCGLRMSKL